MSPHQLRRFAVWFYAAALYNLAWGTLVVAYPEPVVDLAETSGETILLAG